MHNNILRLDGSIARSVSQCTPAYSLLTETLDITDITVGELAELLDNILLGIRVLIGTDMHALATEYGVLTLQILAEQTIDKLISFGVEQIEVVHTILLRADFGHIVCKGQRVCRHVDFGNNLDITLLGANLHIDKLLLGVMAIFGSQTGICVALKTERRLRLRPIVVEILLETIVVKMHLQGVHLVV